MSENNSEVPAQEAPATNDNVDLILPKQFWKSKTFWCLLLAGIMVAFDFGTDDLTTKIQEVIALASLLGAMFGRMDASGPMAIGPLTLPSKKPKA